MNCEQSPVFGTIALASAMVVTFLQHLVMPPAHWVSRSALEIISVVQGPSPVRLGRHEGMSLAHLNLGSQSD